MPWLQLMLMGMGVMLVEWHISEMAMCAMIVLSLGARGSIVACACDSSAPS